MLAPVDLEDLVLAYLERPAPATDLTITRRPREASLP
jgi:hypothetical protein